jgi:hypothetical protein
MEVNDIFTPWPLYPRRNSIRCPLDRKLGGPPSPSLVRVSYPGSYTGGEQNNGNTTKLRNIISLCWLHWKNFSFQQWIFFRLFTLCSARVSALVIVLSDSRREKIGKWKTCPIVKKDNRWCAFSWSICDKNCHIVRCLESDFFWGYVGLHEAWEENISEEEQSVKINTDRTRSS